MFTSKKNSSWFGKEDSGNSWSLPWKKKSATSRVTESITGVFKFNEDPCCASFCPKLTYKQRIIGFAICAGFGWILSFVGAIMLLGSGINQDSIRVFILLYVMGNIIALIATGFLISPKAQCIKMWAETRRYATAFYLLMLAVVFVLAILKMNIWLILGALFIEICAAIWYSASFIPFGRKIIVGTLRRTVCYPCAVVYDGAMAGADGESAYLSDNAA